MWTAERLIAFEDRVAAAFEAKQIRAPIHLSGGNEEQLIEIFRDVKPEDWVFSSWRSHYHALLKGIPAEWVFNEILAGRSMYLMNAEHRFMASGIVGGMLPIACGVAEGIRRKSEPLHVYVFAGDMTARTGLFWEFLQYANGHHLPVTVIVENNEMSTGTPTKAAWGDLVDSPGVDIRLYDYKLVRPHVGTGVNVNFF